MHGYKRHRALFLLIPLLTMASCNPTPSNGSSQDATSLITEESSVTSELIAPRDYEIDPTVTNENGDVYYEIFVRSFADSNGDQKGDLKGIENKIPYLADLGVSGLWLTPIGPSPSYHGYDVMDYKGIHADFGTLSDFDNLMATANDHHIDIILDLVLNHSSNSHPWFIEGKENFRTNNFSKDDPYNKANWYNFMWNNGQVITDDGTFGSNMPELKLDNIAVREEIVSIVKFWLDRGVKGFRLDAASHFYDNASENITFLTWFTNIVKAERADAYIVAEAFIPSFNLQKVYYSGVESLFNFSGADVNGYIIDKITSRIGSTIAYQIAKNYNDMFEINENGLMAMFLSNHDMDRSSQMFLYDFESRQKVAASIYLLTPGVPFIYYGEEIALKGSRMTNQTDANRRLPMIWQKTNDTERTGLPPLTDYPMSQQVKDGVKENSELPFSLLNHYKKVISVRNSYPWIKTARVENFGLNNNALASLKFVARDGGANIHVIHNVQDTAQTVDLSRFIEEELIIKHDIYAVGTRALLEGSTLTLAPYSSVVLERK